MKSVGIIAEYNPFHNGHKWHLRQALQATDADCSVAVMSGNFVQRGEPAVFDKWVRAEAAVREGVDLVLELPVVYSCAGAEFFARGALRILERLGSVDFLAFGAEESSLDKLREIAETVSEESDEFKDKIRASLRAGNSFAAARSKAVAAAGRKGDAEILSAPNNILAVEYLKQLKLQKSQIRPVLIPRKGAGYYEESPEKGVAGAGKLRERMRKGDSIENIGGFLPSESRKIFAGEKPVFSEAIYPYLIYLLTMTDAGFLAGTDGVSEGLENRAVRAAAKAADYEDLIGLIKSKRYSRTSVQRMLMRMFLGIRAADMEAFEACETSYARVLAFSDQGAKLIRRVKNEGNEKIRMITNINRETPGHPTLQKMLDYDAKAAYMYGLIRDGKSAAPSEHRRTPYYRKTNY